MVTHATLAMYKIMTHIIFCNFFYLLGMIWKNNTRWQTTTDTCQSFCNMLPINKS